MTAAERTRQLERNLWWLGLVFTLLFCLGQVTVINAATAAVLAMLLRACAQLGAGDSPRGLNLTAVLMLASAGCAGAAVLEPIFIVPATVLQGAALVMAVRSFARIADWFGGRARWQRARREAVAVLVALLIVCGIDLAVSGADADLGFKSLHARLGQVVVAGSLLVVLYGVFRISLAFRDLRLRVRAANRHAGQASTLTPHG